MASSARALAGGQGRGFAVVATEVRSLSGHSAEAAKAIKNLINKSVEKVQQGSELVDQSGKTLQAIVASVNKVNDIIAEMATSSEEQATGINQVNIAVMEMDRMTQQNAALVEQASTASKAMEEKTRVLSGLVYQFKLEN